MSARKLGHIGFLPPVPAPIPTSRLELPANAVTIRKNGIEFRCGTTLPLWKEMSVALESPFSDRKLTCHGVVVSCQGNRHAGYRVSMVFLGLSRQDEARLRAFSDSALA